MERAEGQGLTPADIGELTEACMSRRGFGMKKTGSICAHNLTSQVNRRCYYPDTWVRRIYAALPQF